MKGYNFDTASRQSVKGIVVIFGLNIYKVLKAIVIGAAAYAIEIFKSDKGINIININVIFIVISIVLYFLILATLKYLNFKFYINQKHFILKEGILNKEETSIAISKIQNVYIKQNLIQQIINVVSLSVETAGDNITEIEIKALPKAKAVALKTILLSDSNIAPKDSNVTKAANSIYYKASYKKLLLEGISENHLKSLGFVIAFIVGLYDSFKDLITHFKFTSRFNTYFLLDQQSLFGLVLLNIALLILFLVIAFLFSLVKTMIQNFNLTVYRKKDGLEISKGLFNKISLGLVSSRIQNTTISTNKFKKMLGLYKLSFTQAMVNKKQQQKFNIIGLSKIQINELINTFYPNVFLALNKYKPNRYFILRAAFGCLFALLLVNIPIFFAPIGLLFLNIPIIILLTCNVIYAYRKAYYSVNDHYIVVGSGKFVDTNTSFLETHKMQSVALKQTIFQKRRDLATIKIYSASKALTILHIEIKMARNIYNFLLYKVESEDKDWM